MDPSGPAGRLEALLEEPGRKASRAWQWSSAIHTRNSGGTMHNKVVYRLARGSAPRRGCSGAAFQFSRCAGRSHGEYGLLMTYVIEDARAALAWLRERYPATALRIVRGFSFGSRAILAMLGCSLNRVPLGSS